MKRLVLCLVRVRRVDYMSERDHHVEESLKQVWVGDESPREAVERHYEDTSDTYGTRWRVISVEKVETIGSPH